jgi:hypothetical protein
MSRVHFSGLTGFLIRPVKRGERLKPYTKPIKSHSDMTRKILEPFPPFNEWTVPCCTLSGYKRAPGRARLGKWGLFDNGIHDERTDKQRPPHNDNANATKS